MVSPSFDLGDNNGLDYLPLVENKSVSVGVRASNCNCKPCNKDNYRPVFNPDFPQNNSSSDSEPGDDANMQPTAQQAKAHIQGQHIDDHMLGVFPCYHCFTIAVNLTSYSESARTFAKASYLQQISKYAEDMVHILQYI